MIVVSDTSPLTYLHQIRRFGLLRTLYGEVIIPPAVEGELKARSELHEGLDWGLLRIVPPSDRELVESLAAFLDTGEGEAIVVASESRPTSSSSMR